MTNELIPTFSLMNVEQYPDYKLSFFLFTNNLETMK